MACLPTLCNATWQPVEPQVLDFLARLRDVAVIGIVGGSDLVKIKEQLGEDGALVACSVCALVRLGRWSVCAILHFHAL